MAVELRHDDQRTMDVQPMQLARNTLVSVVDFMKRQKLSELNRQTAEINRRLQDPQNPLSRLGIYSYTVEGFIINVVRESLDGNSENLFAAVKDYRNYRSELCGTLAAQKLVKDRNATGLKSIISRYIPVEEFDSILIGVQKWADNRA